MEYFTQPPPGVIVTSQSALKHLVDLRLRSARCLRADWEVTIMSGGPKLCELFLKWYRYMSTLNLCVLFTGFSRVGGAML